MENRDVSDRIGESLDKAVSTAADAAKGVLAEKLEGKEEAVKGGAPASGSDGDGSSRSEGKRSGGLAGKTGKIAIAVICIVALCAATYVLVGPGESPMDVVTSSSLKKAINIDELSTAEFVYNGIAEKHKDGSDEVDYRIAYNATVKAGIRMSDVDFEIDKDAKTVRPILPEIVINGVTVDVNNIDYMPSHPNTNLQEVFAICEEDAKAEANQASDLQDVARENLKSIITALTQPILDSEGYALVWDEPESDLVEEAEAAAQEEAREEPQDDARQEGGEA